MTYLKYQKSLIYPAIAFVILYAALSVFSSIENTALRLTFVGAVGCIVALVVRLATSDDPRPGRTIDVDAVPGLAWLSGSDGRITGMNCRMRDYLEVPVASMSVARKSIHPEDRNKTMDLWQQKSLREMRNTHRLMGPDGNYRWFRSVVQPLTSGGTVVGWCGTFIDIDDQKRAEDALRSSEENLRSILDNIPGQIVTADANGDNDYSNRNSVKFFGGSFHEVNASGFKDFIHPDDIEEFDAERIHCIENAVAMDRPCRMRRHDGVYRWFRMRVNPALDENGRVLRWYGLHSDIDDEVKALEKLQAAQEKLAQSSHLAGLAEVSASTAHELKQPLAALVTNSQACQSWLSASPPNLERARRSAERIVKNAMQASEVVARIRGLFAQKQPDKDLVDINEIVDDVIQVVRTKHRNRELTVNRKLDEALPLVPADRVQIQQVFYNLARNCVEAMQSNVDQPVVLDVRSLSVDGAVRVEVVDNGEGISDPQQIFEPFYTTKKDGMGMGLTICRSIIDAHDGKLWAERIVPRGSLFVFELPLPPELRQTLNGRRTRSEGVVAENI